MSEEQVKELLEEIAPKDKPDYWWIDCSDASGYADDYQYNRIVAAIKQNIEFHQLNSALKAENAELESKLECLEKRLNHLLISKSIAAYDAGFNLMGYELNIDEVDSFFNTGNRLIFEYAKQMKVDRVDDFRIETKKEKALTKLRIVYDPIPKEPIELKIKITENSGKSNACPICGKELGQYPVISRKDNKTEICSNCGTLEALEAFHKASKEKEDEQKEV